MSKTSELGKKIKAFRMERTLTQKQAAAYLGISRATLNRIEQGRGDVYDLTVAKILKQLDKAQLAVA